MSRKHITDFEYLTSDTSENPRCPHGPTLLFKRLVDGVERSFYACSACRDRKDCNFFIWADEKLTPAKKQYLNKYNSPQVNHAELYRQFLLVKKEIPSHRAYCHTCSCLCLKSKISENHQEHDVKIDISDYYLKHPSELLQPLENAKKEAQYLFSSSATKVIVNMVQELGTKKVLCIGAPRIHEYIRTEMLSCMDSLLLDIDHRYHQFNDLKHFCWFNSFNNFFFSEDEGPCALEKFLVSGGQNVVLIMDPPFGGRVEPLANTVKEITKLHKKVYPDIRNDMTVMWFFPYFMEPQILASCPDYAMLDYKVNYDNHPLFASGPKGRKHGSPVRIFTNARPQDVTLPKEEGYRYCEICARWVSEENQHCIQCNKCTSKDGRTYIHCNECMRCIKPSWQHCTTCNRCCLPDHVCGEFTPSQLCFNCGQSGHKKRGCPNLSKETAIPVQLGQRASKVSMKQTNFRKDAKILLPEGKLKLRKKKPLFNSGRIKKKKERVSKRRKRLSVP